MTPAAHAISTCRPRSLAAAACALLLGLAVLAPAQAGEGPWTQAQNARARLIEGGPASAPGSILAGVQIQIEPGWKTYWRYPGDAGVPPRFDWSGSSNVASAQVLWPAPKRFSDPSGTYIGYEKEVIFPVEIQLQKPGEPARLDLNIEYAVCKDICIPVESRLQASFDGKDADATTPLVKSYVKKVPHKLALSAGGKVFRRIEATLSGPRPVLAVDVAAEGNSDLFVEAPDGLYLPLPADEGLQKDGSRRFTVDLAQSGNPASLKGRILRLTLETGADAYEAEWRVE